MTLYRGTFLDTPDDPFAGGRLRADADHGLRVVDGEIVERGAWSDLALRFETDERVDLRGGVVLPGFVDTHVHYPQIRAIGGLGQPLLDWLEQRALPEEERLADTAYAAAVAREFVHGLTQAGTTSALVFGSHFAPAVDTLFAEAQRVGLRITSGLVLADRQLRPALHTTPEQALAESTALAERWHGTGRSRYAVTPRFSLSCSDPLLEACAEVLQRVDGAHFTSHVNENPREIEAVEQLFGGAAYVDTYGRHGLLGRHSTLAHNVHPRDSELTTLAAAGASVAHCPTSNAALGSGLFPLARHRDAGVRVALGSDVGAGTGFSLLKEGLQAYFIQQLQGEDGLPLSPAQLLHLATTAGADALDLPQVGHLSVGQRFDAQWLRPAAGTPLAVGLDFAADADDALGRVFTLGTPADVARVWVDGDLVLDKQAAHEQAGDPDGSPAHERTDRDGADASARPRGAPHAPAGAVTVGSEAISRAGRA